MCFRSFTRFQIRRISGSCTIEYAKVKGVAMKIEAAKSAQFGIIESNWGPSRWAFRVSGITSLAFSIAPWRVCFRRKGGSSGVLGRLRHKFRRYRPPRFSTLVTRLHPVAFNGDQSKMNGYEAASPSSRVNWSICLRLFLFPPFVHVMAVFGS